MTPRPTKEKEIELEDLPLEKRREAVLQWLWGVQNEPIAEPTPKWL
jgi:hypothetical protein